MTLLDANGQELQVGVKVLVMGRKVLEPATVTSIRVRQDSFSYTTGAPLRDWTSTRIMLQLEGRTRWCGRRLCTNPKKLVMVAALVQS